MTYTPGPPAPEGFSEQTRAMLVRASQVVEEARQLSDQYRVALRQARLFQGRAAVTRTEWLSLLTRWQVGRWDE